MWLMIFSDKIFEIKKKIPILQPLKNGSSAVIDSDDINKRNGELSALFISKRITVELINYKFLHRT